MATAALVPGLRKGQGLLLRHGAERALDDGRQQLEQRGVLHHIVELANGNLRLL